MVSIYHRAVKHLLNHADVSWVDYSKILRLYLLKLAVEDELEASMTTDEGFYGSALAENMHMGVFIQAIAILNDAQTYVAGKDKDDCAWCSHQSVLLEGRSLTPHDLDPCLVLSQTCQKLCRELRIDTEEFDQLRDDYLDLMQIDCEQQVMDIIADLQAPVLRVANFYKFLQVIAPRITQWKDMTHR